MSSPESFRTLLLFLSLPLASGCVAYPRVYWTTKKGQALVEDGKPVGIKAAILKECETLERETQKTVKEVSTTTDKEGRYRLPVRGVVWHTRLLSGSGCTSHIQMFVCREVCKEADDVDINYLGK